MTHPTDITRAIKAALHKAFPQAKFSVTRGGSWISWNDGSIERTAVENAILAAGLAEPQKGYDGTRWLRIIESDDSIQFDSPARRAAAQQRNQEYLARQQRENAAIAAAQPKRVRHDVERSVPVTAEQERAGFQAVEDLRLRAEASVASSEERSRRPSWTPPLILEGELLEACRTLNYLGPDEPPIARLWAMFADPKAPGRYAREHDSHHPLPGISCRGFQLHAGGARQPTSNVLFEAQRQGSGAWRFGPDLFAPRYRSPRARDWERLVRDRFRLQEEFAQLNNSQERTEQLVRLIEAQSQQIAQIESEDAAAAQTQQSRYELRARAIELAGQRILEFAGATDAQMQRAGRLCGRCCLCWAELTDPISLERGIGPECWSHLIAKVRFCAARLRDEDIPVEAERVAARTREPLNFVRAVLSDGAR